MKKMKDRKMNLMRRTLVGVLTVVMLFGICFSGVQIPASADELYQNTIEQEFDQAVALLCMQYRTFAGSEADRELLDMELESLQTQIEKAENISDAARKDLMERLSEYAPEKKEDTSKTSFYGSGPSRTIAKTSSGQVQTPSISKTVDKLDEDDGKYKLTLTLSGVHDAEMTGVIDIVLIIDRSQSMVNNHRFEPAKTAAKTLISTIAGSDNINATYKIIDFGGYADGVDTTNATDWLDAAGASAAVDAIVAGEYTNYEDAFNRLKVELGQRTNKRIVVFLTDGNPTVCTTPYTHEAYFSYMKANWSSLTDGNYNHQNIANYDFFCDKGLTTNNGSGHVYGSTDTKRGTGVDDSNREGAARDRANVKLCLDRAIDVLETISIERFYAVGCGSVREENLTTLVNSASGAKYKEGVMVGNINDLTAQFQTIASDITDYYCTDVVLTDTLKHQSESKAPTDLLVHIPDRTVQVSVWKPDGTTVGPAASVVLGETDINPQTTLTPSYNPETHQLILAFPESYKLEPDYVYKLHAIIEPTETAYEIYRNNMIEGEQGYPNVGEPGTGEHASDNGNPDTSTTYGFLSNDGAVLSYSFKGKGSQKAYAYPVVQLNPGTLIVTKAVVTEEELTDAQLGQIEEQTTFNIHLDFPPKAKNYDSDTDEYETMDRIITLSDSAVATPEDYLDKFAFTKATEFPVEAGGKFTYNYTLEIPYLSPGTVCTVVEHAASLANHQVKSSMQVDNVDQQDLQAEVTIPRGETMNVAYSNEYSPSTTKLTVEKTVAGNMGDWNQDFTYTVSLNNNAISMNGITYKKYEISNGKDTEIASGTITSAQITDNPITYAPFSFKLKHNQKIVFENVPMNATVIVDEAVEGTKYDAYIDGAPNKSQYGVYEHKAPLPKDGLTVKYKNVYEENIDTGVLTDSVPMVVLLSVSLAAAFLLIRRRRFN